MCAASQTGALAGNKGKRRGGILKRVSVAANNENSRYLGSFMILDGYSSALIEAVAASKILNGLGVTGALRRQWRNVMEQSGRRGGDGGMCV